MGFMDSLNKVAKVVHDTVKEGVQKVKEKTQDLVGDGKAPKADANAADEKAEWYYLAEGNAREGPVTLSQLRDLLAAGKVKPKGMVAKAGMPDWQPADKIAELTAKPAPPALSGSAPAASPSEWYYTKDGKKKVGPITFAELQKLASQGVVNSSDMILKPGVNKWLPASSFPKLFPPTVLPAPDGPSNPAPPPAARPAPPAAKPPCAPAKTKGEPPAAPTIRLKNLKERKAAHVTNTGELVPAEFTAVWNGLEHTGLAVEELVFFCNTQTHLASSVGQSLLNLFASKQTTPPVLHLALTKKEWAVLHVGEDDKPAVANKGTYEQLSWTFSLVEKGLIGSALSIFQTEPQTKAPPVDLLTLKAGEEEIELNLLHGDGLKQLKQTLPRLFLDRIRTHVEEGRGSLAESLLARIASDNVLAKDVELLKQQIGTIVQIEAEYQGGHPEFPEKAVGVLRLDNMGLEFYVPATGQSMRLPFAAIRGILEPRQGRYPQEMIERVKSERASALASLRTAQLGMRSRNAGLRMAAKMNAQTAREKYAAATLGPAPCNRLSVICFSGDQKFKMVFDAAGPTTEFIDEQASHFWSQAATVSNRFSKGAASAGPTPAPPATKASAIVGCPRCHAKLRARDPGVIECPGCQAKVRVAAEKFKA